jgi:hypothetical protein
MTDNKSDKDKDLENLSTLEAMRRIKHGEISLKDKPLKKIEPSKGAQKVKEIRFTQSD